MPLAPLWSGSELLRKLLADFLAGKLKVDVFCRDVEVAYNDAIDDSALTSAEQPIFEELFDQVAWFSPYPRETWEYPGYKTETEIRSTAEATAQRLSRI